MHDCVSSSGKTLGAMIRFGFGCKYPTYDINN